MPDPVDLTDLQALQKMLDEPEPLDPELAECVQHIGPPLGLVLQHRLVQSVPFIPQTATLQNRMLAYKRERIAAAIAANDAHQFVFLHERPWRPEALLEVAMWDGMTGKTFARVLGETWVDTEQEGDERWRVLWKMFPEAWRHRMTADENRRYNALPSKLTVYRGEWGKVQKYTRWSWTLDLKTAQFFANRLRPKRSKARILSVTVPKEMAEAFFTRRGETEIVLNPNALVERYYEVEVRDGA